MKKFRKFGKRTGLGMAIVRNADGQVIDVVMMIGTGLKDRKELAR